jgi:hypothetical protein
MQANVFPLLSWASNAVREMPEPLVMLAVGGLLLAIGFSRRIRRSTRPATVSQVQAAMDPAIRMSAGVQQRANVPSTVLPTASTSL